MQVRPLGWEDPLEEGMATHSSVLAWRISWTEEPGWLQFIGSQRVRHYWSDLACTHTWVPLGCMGNTLGSPPRFYDLQVQLIPQLLWVLAARDSQLLTGSWELLHPGSYKLPTPPPPLGSPQSMTADMTVEKPGLLAQGETTLWYYSCSEVPWQRVDFSRTCISASSLVPFFHPSLTDFTCKHALFHNDPCLRLCF